MALLNFDRDLGFDYVKMREGAQIEKMYPFSSERKRMNALVKTEAGYRIFCKGASEIVLTYCKRYLTATGAVEPIEASRRNEIEDSINKYATDALRTICLAYCDFTNEEYAATNWEAPVETDLIFIGVVGIMDPLRPEVVKAIEQCKTAGIKVRMVTGDSKTLQLLLISRAWSLC